MNILKNKTYATIGILIIFSALLWSKIYLDSQNYLINSPNWYAFKSYMVDNYIISFETAMSRSTLSGNEIDLRGQANADIILHKKKMNLKELSFKFMVPNNSYLDVLFNFKDGASSFFRLSKSSMHESGFYSMKKSGEYLKFFKSDFRVDSSKRYKGSLKNTENGVVFYVNDEVIATWPGVRILYGEFGFESGLIGAAVSNVVAIDSDNKQLDTSFDHNSNLVKIIFINFSLIVTLLFGIFLISKNKLQSLKTTIFVIFCVGVLWLSFDFLYYSKLSTAWSFEDEATVLTSSPGLKADFETLRFKVVQLWGKILGESSISLDTYEQIYGKIRTSQGEDDCFRDKCQIRNDHFLSSPPVKRLGMLGESAHVSVKMAFDETSTFIQMHQYIQKNSGDIESINYSSPELRFMNSGEKLFSKFISDKINIVIVLLNIRYTSPVNELRAFLEFLKKCKHAGIDVLLVNDPANPEKIFYQTDYQLEDMLLANKIYHVKNDELMNSWNEKFKAQGLIILDPSEVLYHKENIHRGKMWWDNAHITSYAHVLFGSWLGKKIVNYLEDQNE